MLMFSTHIRTKCIFVSDIHMSDEESRSPPDDLHLYG